MSIRPLTAQGPQTSAHANCHYQPRSSLPDSRLSSIHTTFATPFDTETMSDEDEKPTPAPNPARQSAPSQPVATPAGESQEASSGSSSETEHKTEDEAGETKGDSKDEEVGKQDEEDDLTVARRFLSDPSVQSSPLPSKIKFLQNKGLSESTIQTLLGTDNTQKDVRLHFSSKWKLCPS
jgi:hypothetical protein